MKTYLSFLVFLMLLNACSHGTSSKQNAESTMHSSNVAMCEYIAPPTRLLSSPKVVNEETVEVQKINTPKKLIKKATIKIEVDDYTTARKKIMDIIQLYKGFNTSETETSDDNSIQNKMIIRASGNQFDSITEHILRTAKHIDSKDIEIEDVTAEYVDLEMRIKAKKEIEKRYLQMLSFAKKVDEMVEVQGKIDKITEETEVNEGNLKLMGDQVAYSTLNLEIYQKLNLNPATGKEHGPGLARRIGEALMNGWLRLLKSVIYILEYWPFLVIIAIIYFAWLRFRIKARSKLKAA